MTAEDRREDRDAEALARKMADVAEDGRPFELLPYARALIKAEQALAQTLPRGPDDCPWRAALTSLRAVMGEP